MADEKPKEAEPQKKSKWPWGATAWGVVAGACLFRALYHPRRAVIESGVVTRCAAGSGCVPSMLINGTNGAEMVYAVTAGKVFTRAELAIASKLEPIVIGYGTGAVQLLVEDGEEVGIGTPLALMKTVNLRIVELQKNAGSGVTRKMIEPASWLAARGMRVSNTTSKSALWCTKGRTLEMPAAVATCNIKLPKPPGLMLLPVSVTTT